MIRIRSFAQFNAYNLKESCWMPNIYSTFEKLTLLGYIEWSRAKLFDDDDGDEVDGIKHNLAFCFLVLF